MLPLHWLNKEIQRFHSSECHTLAGMRSQITFRFRRGARAQYQGAFVRQYSHSAAYIQLLSRAHTMYWWHLSPFTQMQKRHYRQLHQCASQRGEVHVNFTTCHDHHHHHRRARIQSFSIVWPEPLLAIRWFALCSNMDGVVTAAVAAALALHAAGHVSSSSSSSLLSRPLPSPHLNCIWFAIMLLCHARSAQAKMPQYYCCLQIRYIYSPNTLKSSLCEHSLHTYI